MAKVDLFSLGIKPQYTFDQLVVGGHNQMAAAASLQVSKNLGEAYNPLFIFGPTGVGKTHMMQAIAHAALLQSPELKMKYISSERFVNDVISAISEDNLVGFRQHYNQLDLMLMDDVQFLSESKSAQGEFLHVFNNMHQQSRQVVLTADRSPYELDGFDKSIRSRLEWGLSADVKLPDSVTRIEILKLKQRNYGNLSEEALKYVSDLLFSNVRELEGFLKRLHAYVTLSHQSVNMDLIKSVVFEIQPNASEHAASQSRMPQSSPSISPIVASAMNIPLDIAPLPVKDSAPVVSAKKEEPVVSPPEEKPVLGTIAPAAQSNGRSEPFTISLNSPPQPPVDSPPPIFSQVVPVEKVDPAPIPQKTVLSALPPTSENKPPHKPEVIKAPLVPPVVTDSTEHVVEVPIPPKPVEPIHNSSEPVVAASPPPVSEPDPGLQFVSSDFEDEPLPSGHKEVAAAFFYPIGCEKQLDSVVRKFQEVIKKHKLKFRLKRAVNHGYEFKGKVNYSVFVEVCRNNKVPVAIVIGPPTEGGLTDQEFYDLLSVTLDVQGVSLQLVTWNEIDKDYRYLNLALDIALVRMR